LASLKRARNDPSAFLKAQLARLPTRAEVSWIVLKATMGALAAIGPATLLLVE